MTIFTFKLATYLSTVVITCDEEIKTERKSDSVFRDRPRRPSHRKRILQGRM